MAVHKTLVLTLRCHDYSETSQVIVMLGRETGRVRCLAKGSKRGKNPFGGPLDQWVYGEAVFSLKDPSKLGTLMELYDLDRFEGLRTRLPAYYAACFVTELMVALLPDVEPDPEVFDLALEALRRLSRGPAEAARAVALAVAWRLLGRLGYGSALDECVECGKPLAEDRAVGYCGALGGPVCESCRSVGRVVELPAKAVEATGFLATAPWDQVEKVRLSEATAAPLRTALGDRLRELAGRDVKSLAFL